MPFTSDQIARALEAKAKRLTLEDLDRVRASVSSVQEKLAEFPPSLNDSKVRAELLLEFCGDESGSFEARKLAAGALLYLSSPLDLIPDHEPDGYADDAAVVDLATKRITNDLRAFCTRTGRQATLLDP
jgi:uncharacterized membrane protein YkvA (DUF1232 family)